METCEGCGFGWDAIDPESVVPRSRAGIEGFQRLLADDPNVTRRPTPTRWSTVEYAAHVRDVLLNVRDRIVLGAIEDNPVPKGLHPDARVSLGLYAGDTPELVSRDLEVAVGLFCRTLAVLTPEQLSRPIFYGYPRPETRTLRWGAAQVLHEVEHHLADATANTDLNAQ